ncbi:MAG: hypothetical protein K2O73_06355 [Lachnospiraceae bacterium]|nr:hypothetical protein [Lachnospiraceae bacterium]
MKKKTIVTMVVLAVTVMSMTACGRDPETVTTMAPTELEELDTTEKDNQEPQEPDMIETENTDTEVEPTGSEAPEENPESTQTTTTQQKPNNSTQTTGNSQKPNNSAQTTGNSTTAHTHVWKEHTATKQEWVPSVVTVPDYATQQVDVGTIIRCNCGAEFDANDYNGFRSHMTAHLLAGEPDNYATVPVYEEQTVQIGSHTEDQGHYEDVSYVDYYYCDCGATK